VTANASHRFPGGDASEAITWLRAASVDTVRVEWTDLGGLARGKILPLHAFAGAMRDGVQFCGVAMAFALDSTPVPDSGVGGEMGYGNVRALPDLATLRLLAHEPRTAQVLCDVEFLDGEPATITPRAVLRRQCEALAERGLQARIAPEMEFYLLDGDFQPRVMGMPCYGMESRFRLREALAPLIAAAEPHARLLGYHHEHAPGQIELNVAPVEALQAADDLQRLRQCLREAALAHGHRVSFMAKPFNGLNGNACQLNLSLWDHTGNRCWDSEEEALSALALHAIGGLLAHLPELTAILLPTANAYKRLVPGHFAPLTLGWGLDNRGVAVRACGEHESARLELRVCGGDINPYLAMAGMLAAVIAGLDDQSKPGLPLEGDLDSRDLPRLPGDWAAAVAAFEDSAWAREALGEDFHALFGRFQRFELSRYQRLVSDIDRQLYLPVL